MLESMPAINATLNGTAAVLLLLGYIMIRRGNRRAHGWLMASAFVVSSVFLIGYLYYHAHVGSKRFPDPGWIRTVYLGILLTHTILAAAVPVLAIMALWRAAKGQFARHKQVARPLFPIWLYVSITGVVIYWMLYHVAGVTPG